MKKLLTYPVIGLLLVNCQATAESNAVLNPAIATQTGDFNDKAPVPFSCDGKYDKTSTEFSERGMSFQDGTLPPCVFELTNLRKMVIVGQDCCGRTIDENGNWTKPCYILQKIPADIKKLTLLEHLEIRINAIDSLPPEMAELKNLRTLDLTDNSGLSEYGVISKLENLETLYLFGCYLKSLPADIGNLKNLKNIGLAGNNFDETEQQRIREAFPQCEISF